jgi:hypothetical protein
MRVGDHLAFNRVVAFFCFFQRTESSMRQSELEIAVAAATGESVELIHRLGFGIADPLDTSFDPEPMRPQVFDWDEMAPVPLPLE